MVDWPSAGLRELTLIDTPGIASLSQDVSGRSTEFLPPRRRPPHGRRCRHLSPAASPLLRCPVPGILQGQHRGPIRGCQRLAVLSRADEIGAGRIDSLISAAVIADRYSRDQNLKPPLALGVVPVAGLLAQSSRTMRQTDFEAMKLLAQMDRNQRERLMLSADLFVRSTEPEGLGRAAKASLVQRFGLFGIRLGVALIRGGGISNPTELAHELARRSGLGQLLDNIAFLFQTRAEALKARAAVVGLEALLRTSRRDVALLLEANLERLRTGAHEFRELKLLATLRTEGISLTPEQSAEAERLVGGRGSTPPLRLGLDAEASPEQITEAARNSLNRWRLIAENPLTEPAALEACRVVLRSCEGMLAAIPAVH